MSTRTFNPASKLELLIRCFYQGLPKDDSNLALLEEMRVDGLVQLDDEERIGTTPLGSAWVEAALRTPKPELKQLYVDADGEPLIWNN